ncbi:MAG: ketopantoate reductase family protein [Rhizobiaceae bacterium]
MKICIIGAGAMGCLYGARLRQVGFDVSMVDVWEEHVRAINNSGLLLDGIGGEIRSHVKATTDPSEIVGADLVIVLVDANSTAAAGTAAAAILAPDGFVLTLQNGIGNLDELDRVLGRDRVMGGLSYHSAALRGPGHATHTHAGPTWIGQRGGTLTGRLDLLAELFGRADLDPQIVDDIELLIWEKWVLNSSVNAVCAITGLRQGEIPRTPPVEAFQDKLLEELFAVLAAKGIGLDPDAIRRKVKEQCWKKFNKPSMLQHVEAGKRTEIDALNGAVAREGRALGISTPYNDALALLVKGLEKARAQALHGPPIDYDHLEAEAARVARPEVPGVPSSGAASGGRAGRSRQPDCTLD